ncbi:hypothetical protein BLNAU_14703 [Blattamonas nauphoetae]|uniref:Uncharacterized protein n=1 Tax=Blattamonas nauphoetae TaxID=2049346 RepID=A0ABQ9XCY5_9EUKA|nr:hypothetical protein BLNAU_14703 [Blattamonas nauphoetae]
MSSPLLSLNKDNTLSSAATSSIGSMCKEGLTDGNIKGMIDTGFLKRLQTSLQFSKDAPTILSTLDVLDSLCPALKKLLKEEETKQKPDLSDSTQIEDYSTIRRCQYALTLIQQSIVDCMSTLTDRELSDHSVDQIQNKIGGILVRHFPPSISKIDAPSSLSVSSQDGSSFTSMLGREEGRKKEEVICPKYHGANAIELWNKDGHGFGMYAQVRNSPKC